MEEIKIKVKELRHIQLKDLFYFQDNLKDLSLENFNRLKENIKKGYCFAIHAWEDGDKLQVIDGHQRLRVLKKMEEEGFNVPKIPVVIVDAKSLKEAKDLVLQGASQFGNFTEEGLYEYLQINGIPMNYCTENYYFPEINMKNFELSYFQDIDPSTGLNEIEKAFERDHGKSEREEKMWLFVEFKEKNEFEKMKKVFCTGRSREIDRGVLQKALEAYELQSQQG